jgi:hypothetical protein
MLFCGYSESEVLWDYGYGSEGCKAMDKEKQSFG